MLKVDELRQLMRKPADFLQPLLQQSPSIHQLFLQIVLPLCLIRPAMVVLRSVLSGHFLTGTVLALGSFVLLVGSWFAAGMLFPTLARQFNVSVGDRQAYVLVAGASTPLWLAGALYIIPEDPPFFFFWSRSLVLLIASYGLYIFFVGLVQLQVPKPRLPLLAATAASYVVLYSVFFLLLGLMLHVVLLFLRITS